MATSLRLPPELEADLKRLAVAHSRSVHGEMLYALKQYVQQTRERGFIVDQRLQAIARQAIDEARAEGMGEADAKWMAQGAVMREGRNQGVIGEELSAEMQAAIAEVVKQELK